MNYIKLVKKAIKGDEAAFETLIVDQSDKLYRTAFLYVRNKEDTLDVLQETTYKAFISMDQLKHPEYFSTWIIKILIRTAYDVLNRKKKIILTGDEFFESVTEIRTEKIELRLDLTEAISTLNLHYQTVIILFYYHDLPISKIAETMNKPEGTIKTYLHRAKR
ncbi:sigma-70 family RNA polymerase sigma factor [Sporosarcina limicola]|uniref:RNA polymerase sigma-70 factor (ECF subfamily) n=1 Tax=Sporosarcina limicola TaxID=34101 RepID=A0A927RG69_9BACL|nr:sigma-70 family RNA polymerase sigma factor [Sporosarcina limicola]MBE1556232.1 RNA polymerase sigma-70 factor (ECF subfamily) [Sporosarcina limicola]